MADKEKTYAVLTGDLVRSSRLTSADSKNAMACLKRAAAEIGQQHPAAVVGRIDTFRHDSWQLLLGHPALAFRIAVFIRAALKMESDADTKYDTRISIGIGAVELISKRRISDSRGPAFTSSGKGLDELDGQRLALSTGGARLVPWSGIQNGIVPLLDCVVGDWTPTESRAVCGALKGWTQEETAGNWPRRAKTQKRPTRQAVSDSLVRAHWSAIEAVLGWIENEITQTYGLA